MSGFEPSGRGTGWLQSDIDHIDVVEAGAPLAIKMPAPVGPPFPQPHEVEQDALGRLQRQQK